MSVKGGGGIQLRRETIARVAGGVTYQVKADDDDLDEVYEAELESASKAALTMSTQELRMKVFENYWGALHEKVRVGIRFLYTPHTPPQHTYTTPSSSILTTHRKQQLSVRLFWPKQVSPDSYH